MQFLESLLPAHFTRLNRIIFFLSLLFSFLSLIALLNISPNDEDASRKLLATLAEEEQFVTRKFSNSLSFNEINRGENLYNGDTIVTGANSKAKIVFLKSKNILNIPQKGLVKIEEGESGENIEIQKGLAEFVIQKDQKLNIIQGNEKLVITSTSGTNGSGKLFYKNDKLIVQVDKGQININDSKGNAQNIKEAESASVSVVEKVITKIVTSMLVSPKSEDNVDIWEGINLAWGFNGPIEVKLSKSPNFSDDIQKVTASTSPYKWNLPLTTGRYFLKVRAVDPKAKEEEVITLNMVSTNSISTYNPPTESLITLSPGSDLKLSWNQVPTEKYRVNVELSSGKKDSFITTQNEFLINNVKDSKITWNVEPLLKSGVYLDSNIQNIVNIKFEGQNKIQSPIEGQNFRFGKDKINFAWSSLPKENLEIKIANSEGAVLMEKTIQGQKLELVPKMPGKYTMELTSKDYPGVTPAIVNFNVQASAATWVSKEKIVLESIDPDNQIVDLKFDTLTKNLNELGLDVYSDELLKNKIRSDVISSKTIKFPIKNFGTYCVRIRGQENNPIWIPSESKCIVYIQQALFDIIQVPKNLIMKFVDVNGVASYSFEVPPVKRADIYEVQVFKDVAGKNLVYTDRSQTTVFKWPSRKAGIYFYRYRVFDSKKRSSEYSGTAKLVFPISPLSDWQE